MELPTPVVVVAVVDILVVLVQTVDPVVQEW
jgi:hypothetical protein